MFNHITMAIRFPGCMGTMELEPRQWAQSKININLAQFADCLKYSSELFICNWDNMCLCPFLMINLASAYLVWFTDPDLKHSNYNGDNMRLCPSQLLVVYNRFRSTKFLCLVLNLKQTSDLLLSGFNSGEIANRSLNFSSPVDVSSLSDQGLLFIEVHKPNTHFSVSWQHIVLHSNILMEATS